MTHARSTAHGGRRRAGRALGAALVALAVASPQAAAAAPAPGTDGVVLRVAPVARVDGAGLVTYQGTLQCDAPQTVWMWSQVLQGGSTSIADEPYGSVQVQCTGAAVPWTRRVSAYAGPAFSAGSATVRSSLYVWPGAPFEGLGEFLTPEPTQVRLVAVP